MSGQRRLVILGFPVGGGMVDGGGRGYGHAWACEGPQPGGQAEGVSIEPTALSCMMGVLFALWYGRTLPE
jgi:uncharacterized spore protein YtfJ